MKIDIFNHFLPPAYLAALEHHAGDQLIVRCAAKIRPLWDVAERLRMLAPWPELRQVVTLGQPTPELVAGPERSPELARIANDGMAQIRDAHPDRFPAFVASLPMNNVAAALQEMDRAVGELGARGIQVLTNVNGRPLDHPDFFPIFERAAQHYDVPVWLHPYRPPTAADYPTESLSEYEVWVVLGWPHESSVAMARLVFAEMFDRLPKLRVITHHCGATVPYLLGRVGPMWDELGERSDNARYRAIRARMAAKSQRPIDFFGPDYVVFATDFPFGPENGLWFLRENMRSVDELEMPARERDGIYFGNALKLMRMER